MIYEKLPDFPNIQIKIADEEIENRALLFVSPGEYPIYDHKEYDDMDQDKNTYIAYRKAIQNTVKDKSVIDIGCGAHCDWALISLDNKAKNATAIEVIENSYKSAKQEIIRSKYKNIELVNSLSAEYQPKEKVDVCVSEIIGTIASSEGVINTLNDAKFRLLKDDGIMIPYSCKTMIGAVCIQEIIPTLEFHPDTLYYINEIFKYVGKPFNTRLTIINCSSKYLMSTLDYVEDLNFNDFNINNEMRSVDLIIKKSGYIDSVLLWINLLAEKNGKPVNSLYQQTGWEPLVIPLFEEAIKVKKGDILKINFARYLSSDNYHPSYIIEGYINKNYNIFCSKYDGDNNLIKNEFYKKLFKIGE